MGISQFILTGEGQRIDCLPFALLQGPVSKLFRVGTFLS